MAPENIHDAVLRWGFVGLKCYHVYAARERTFEATIEEYLPETQVRVADELGLSITLHIVRATAAGGCGKSGDHSALLQQLSTDASNPRARGSRL
jgi:hypothetical protein